MPLTTCTEFVIYFLFIFVVNLYFYRCKWGSKNIIIVCYINLVGSKGLTLYAPFWVCSPRRNYVAVGRPSQLKLLDKWNNTSHRDSVAVEGFPALGFST
jgi:hypothetical protein